MVSRVREPSTMMGDLSVAFLLTRHPAGRISPIMPEVIALLRAQGANVDALYPDDISIELGRLRVEHDLYVLKSGTETALSLAGSLHWAGATILNPYPVAAACRDKIVTTQVLRSAGVPLPETFVAARPAQVAELLDGGPLVVKPHRGSQGRGVHVVHRPEDLDDVPPGDGPLFVQRYHRPNGRDRKLYRIGDQVFGVKRVWPARTYEEKLGEAFEVGGELREIAVRCGAAFGIDLYGLDIVETDDGPYVVDFSSFPGFKGVPDAARLLADHVRRAARTGLAAARVAPTMHAAAVPR